MKIFLRYVGNLRFQRGVEEDIGVHQTSDSKVGMQLADQKMHSCRCNRIQRKTADKVHISMFCSLITSLWK